MTYEQIAREILKDNVVQYGSYKGAIAAIVAILKKHMEKENIIKEKGDEIENIPM